MFTALGSMPTQIRMMCVGHLLLRTHCELGAVRNQLRSLSVLQPSASDVGRMI